MSGMFRSGTTTHSGTGSWPTLDDSCIPELSPPAPSRGHPRSRTTIDIPPLLPRSASQSPTRSSTFLPFIGTSRSSSPKRASPSEAAEYSVDDREHSPTRRTNRKNKVGNIASWFEGSSEPVNIGLVGTPKDEGEDEDKVMETVFSRSQESVPRSGTSLPAPKPIMMQSANSSRFSFFSRKASVVQPKHEPDTLANWNVTEALFPDGGPDEFSAASFKTLQQNAEGALRLLQAAYKEQLAELRKITSEKTVQADELEASTTRNESLKAQLLEMADRSSEQEKELITLRAENGRLKNNEVALRSIRVITDNTSDQSGRSSPARRNRSSDVSFAESVDSTDSDISSVASVFSENEPDLNERSMIRTPGTSVGCPSPTLKSACRVITPNVQHSRVEHLRSLTTNIEGLVSQQCQICHGVASNEAWGVLGVMKAENVGLKDRIVELEKSRDSAMDLLNWMPSELDELSTRCGRMLSAEEETDYESPVSYNPRSTRNGLLVT